MSSVRHQGRHKVRWSKAEEAFEMQCDTCLQWLPIDAEWWVPKHGFNRCRECYRVDDRKRAKAWNDSRRADPQYRLLEAEALRVKRHANREWWLEYRRAYYREHREQITARRRELYAARKAA